MIKLKLLFGIVALLAAGLAQAAVICKTFDQQGYAGSNQVFNGSFCGEDGSNGQPLDGVISQRELVSFTVDSHAFSTLTHIVVNSFQYTIASNYLTFFVRDTVDTGRVEFRFGLTCPRGDIYRIVNGSMTVVDASITCPNVQ